MWKIITILLLFSNVFGDIRSLLGREFMFKEKCKNCHGTFLSDPKRIVLLPLKCNGDKIKIEDWDFDMYFCKSHIEKLCKQGNQDSLSNLCKLPLNEKSSYYIADVLDSLSYSQIIKLVLKGDIEFTIDGQIIESMLYAKKSSFRIDKKNESFEVDNLIFIDKRIGIFPISTVKYWF